MALGADGNQIIGLMLKDAAGPIGAGVVVGLGGAFASARPLAVEADPLILAAVTIALAALAFAASAIPALRAGRLDPGVVLRAE